MFTQSDLNKLLKLALKLKKKMDALSATGDEADKFAWYTLETDLKTTLNEIKRLDFTKLSKKNLITYLCLCSSYRPIEPWQLLVTLALRADQNNERASVARGLGLV